MTAEILKPKAVHKNTKPSRQEAEQAVRTLLLWIGEDPERSGLVDTPARVIKSYEEFFAGYAQDAASELGKTFDDIEGYDDMVIVKNIDFVSHCEHHMVSITGQAHVAYWPTDAVVGISKLARVVDVFARRLVSQENMTTNIMKVIDETLKPKGVAVMVEADHQCMSIRGVNKKNSATVTTRFSGVFKDDVFLRERFLKHLER
jgi:GTP cyclohydrolase I